MSKYKPYPKYKKSGVEWLGDVPDGWKKTYLKYISNINMGQSPSSKNYNMDGEGIEFLQGNADFEKLNPIARIFTTEIKKVSNIEDILFTVRAPVGAMNISDKKYAIGRGLCAISANKKSKNSFIWWLMKVLSIKLKTVATGSTYEAVSIEQVSNLQLELPPLKEQKKISTYLDQKTKKIDTLIEKQQTLIKILKEKRQSVISHAVTKGLDGSVEMKDSGVEWLGDVPKYWDVKQVKYLLNNNIGIKIGPFGSALKLDDMVKIGYKVYGQENVIKNNFSLGKRFISNQKFNTMIVYKVEPNDILITMMGTIGRCIVVPKNIEIGIIDSHLIKIRTNELISSEYFSLMIDKSEVVKTQLKLNSKGSIMQGLNSTIIKALIFPLPPIVEQYKILNYLDQKTKQIDTLITKSTKAIELLKERRIALISAVVTGKIDVRNA